MAFATFRIALRLMVWPMSRGHAALLGFGAFDEVGGYGEGGESVLLGGLLRVCPKAHDDAVDVVGAQSNGARCADEEPVE